MKTRTSGLTVIEILVVVSIIALLVGLLLPAVHTVQKMAKETKQKAQFTSIELGLAAFKSDYGDYPPSNWWNPTVGGRPAGLLRCAEAVGGAARLGPARLPSGFRLACGWLGPHRRADDVRSAEGQPARRQTWTSGRGGTSSWSMPTRSGSVTAPWDCGTACSPIRPTARAISIAGPAHVRPVRRVHRERAQDPGERQQSPDAGGGGQDGLAGHPDSVLQSEPGQQSDPRRGDPETGSTTCGTTGR